MSDDYEDIIATQRSQQSRPMTPNSVNIKMQRKLEVKQNTGVTAFDY